MPDPQSISNPEPNLHGASTAGWNPPVEAGPDPDLATRTRLAGSTPGLSQPDARTDTDDTERIHSDPFESATLPTIPGYRIEKLVGRGGMATVYRAVHLEMNRVVALKLINPGGRDEFYVRERFEREVKTLARVEHDRVVPVYHCGYWHGFPYLTMKFIPAGPLSQHVERFRDRPREAVRLIAKVARGVQALHDAGIIHRDIKPLNILLNDGDEPLVADFGLAKWMEETNSELTVTHVPLGTRQYMSPEQTLGQKSQYAAGCDIWSLGVTLYELLAGSRPFSDADTGELFERIRTAEPPELPESVPAPIAAIVAKCMAKQPEHRYHTAAALASDLERWLVGESFPVPPPPPPPKTSPPPWLSAAGICAILALIFLPPVLVPVGQVHAEPANTDPGRLGPLTAPQVAKKPIHERLALGETVVAIDGKGRLLEPALTLPGCIGEPVEADRMLQLLSPELYAIELYSAPAASPVRFEGEVVLMRSIDYLSRASIYLGAMRWDGPNGWNETMVVLTVHYQVKGFRLAGIPLDAATYRVELALRWWDGHGHLQRPSLTSLSSTKIVSASVNETEDWHTLALQVAPDGGIDAFWNHRPLRHVSPDDIRNNFHAFSKTLKLPAPAPFRAPFIGPGMGLCVENARAGYRNVKLVPLNPVRGE